MNGVAIPRYTFPDKTILLYLGVEGILKTRTVSIKGCAMSIHGNLQHNLVSQPRSLSHPRDQPKESFKSYGSKGGFTEEHPRKGVIQRLQVLYSGDWYTVSCHELAPLHFGRQLKPQLKERTRSEIKSKEIGPSLRVKCINNRQTEEFCILACFRFLQSILQGRELLT